MKIINDINKSVLQRLIIFNLLLVIIMTIIPQVFYFKYLNIFIENHVNEANMQSIKYIQDSMDENIITEIMSFPSKYLSNLPSNEDLTYPLDNDISNNTSRIINIYRSINDIKGKNAFIHSVDLVYPKSNILFYSGNVIFLDKATEGNKAVPSWLSTKNYKESQFKWLVHTDSQNENEILSFIRTVPLFAEEDKIKGIVSVNIETKFIRETLQKYQSENDGITLILDSENNIVSSNQTILSNDIINQIKESYSSSSSKNLGEDIGRIFIDKKQYMASTVSSNINNWTYMSLLPINEYYNKTNKVRNIILIAGVIMLLINISMASLLAKKVHKPIVDEIEELKVKIEKNQPIIKQHFFLSLFNGNMAEDLYAEEQGKLFNFIINDSSFVGFDIYVHGSVLTSFENLVLLPVQIIEALESEDAPYKSWFIHGEGSHIYGVTKLDEEVSLNMAIEYIENKLKIYAGSNYTIGTGNIYSGRFDSVSKSFKEAQTAAEHYYIYPHLNIIKYSDLDLEEIKDSESTGRMLNKLPSYVHSADKKAMEEVIDSIVEEMSRGRYKLENCKNILMDIVTVIKKSINDLGYSSNEVFGYNIREKYKKINNINEFKEWIYDVINIAVEKINERKSDSDYKLDEKIIKYISDHIYDNLSLDTLADYIGVTPNYLSKIFKQHFGQTFSEYVIDIKMKNAIILLEEKKFNVLDIAYKLGYNSTHYFIKVFKQKYGITPKQYQKQNCN